MHAVQGVKVLMLLELAKEAEHWPEMVVNERAENGVALVDGV